MSAAGRENNSAQTSRKKENSAQICYSTALYYYLSTQELEVKSINRNPQKVELIFNTEQDAKNCLANLFQDSKSYGLSFVDSDHMVRISAEDPCAVSIISKEHVDALSNLVHTYNLGVVRNERYERLISDDALLTEYLAAREYLLLERLPELKEEAIEKSKAESCLPIRMFVNEGVEKFKNDFDYLQEIIALLSRNLSAQEKNELALPPETVKEVNATIDEILAEDPLNWPHEYVPSSKT